MKRKGYLFEKICDMDNLRLAEVNAGHGKGSRQEVAQFRANLEQNLAEIRAQLVNKTYHTSAYTCFIKHEPKERVIFKLPYRDRVVQWAIMQVLEPVWTPTLTRDTYACIRGRGVHSLLHQLRKDLRNDPDGQPVMGWVKHITFTGSKTLAEDMADLDLSEPVQCQVLKQKCGDQNRFFYKLEEWNEPQPSDQ